MALSLAVANVIRAQGGSSRPAPPPRAVQVLDTWVITHLRDAHLLTDSANLTRPAVSDVAPPHIESVGDAATGDTVYAMNFTDRRDASALRVGARVLLTASSGSVTGINADIVARRQFRAPRVPGADTASVGGWRFGWAYLAIVRRQFATTNASVYRGWVLLDA